MLFDEFEQVPSYFWQKQKEFTDLLTHFKLKISIKDHRVVSNMGEKSLLDFIEQGFIFWGCAKIMN